MSRKTSLSRGPRNLFATVILAVSALTAQAHDHHGSDGGDAAAAIGKLGAIHMPISCAASVQAPFERGVALLHSFWHEEAFKQFKEVAAADPTCAMAEWGPAMTEWRSFWDGLPDDRRN